MQPSYQKEQQGSCLRLVLRGLSLAQMPCAIASQEANPMEGEVLPNRLHKISKFQPGQTQIFQEACVSEVVPNNSDPVWKETKLSPEHICNSDCDLPILLSVWEQSEESNRTLPMGSCQTTIAELQRAQKIPSHVFTLTRGPRSMGALTVVDASVVPAGDKTSTCNNNQDNESEQQVNETTDEGWLGGALTFLKALTFYSTSEVADDHSDEGSHPRGSSWGKTEHEDAESQDDSDSSCAEDQENEVSVDDVIYAARVAFRRNLRSKKNFSDMVSEAILRNQSLQEQQKRSLLPKVNIVQQIMDDMPQWNLDGDGDEESQEKEWVVDKRCNNIQQREEERNITVGDPNKQAAPDNQFDAIWDECFWGQLSASLGKPNECHVNKEEKNKPKDGSNNKKKKKTRKKAEGSSSQQTKRSSRGYSCRRKHRDSRRSGKTQSPNAKAAAADVERTRNPRSPEKPSKMGDKSRGNKTQTGPAPPPPPSPTNKPKGSSTRAQGPQSSSLSSGNKKPNSNQKERLGRSLDATATQRRQEVLALALAQFADKASCWVAQSSGSNFLAEVAAAMNARPNPKAKKSKNNSGKAGTIKAGADLPNHTKSGPQPRRGTSLPMAGSNAKQQGPNFPSCSLGGLEAEALEERRQDMAFALAQFAAAGNDGKSGLKKLLIS